MKKTKRVFIGILIFAFVIAPIKPSGLINYLSSRAIAQDNEITEGETFWNEDITVTGDFFVGPDAFLTIKKGVTVTLDNSNFIVEGGLFVEGTVKDPVKFKKANENSVYFLTIRDGAWAEFKNFDISEAGYFDDGGIPPVQVRNSTVSRAYAEELIPAIQIDESSFLCDACAFHSNAAGISLKNLKFYSEIKVNRSKFFDNEKYDVNYDNSKDLSSLLDFQHNWWGSRSGPEKTAGNINTSNFTVKEDFRDPVIVIPGIMGSWKVGDKWELDPITHSYDNLIFELDNEGYTPGYDLFEFPYQWRNSNVENAEYLGNYIDAIETQKSWPKVDIVAHSMGGLLARQYIESFENEYEIDVDQLITLGTPHNGSLVAYLMREAGEGFSGIDGYAAKKIFTREAEKASEENLFYYIRNRPMSSVQELLPTNNYLFNLDSNSPKIYPTGYPRNEFLEKLNSEDGMIKLNMVEFDNIYGEYSGEKTLGGFKTINAPAFGDYWEHGYPKNYNFLGSKEGLVYVEGDGTVPKDSAISVPSDERRGVPSSHNKLPTEAQKDVLEYLTGIRPANEIRDAGMDIREILLIQVYCPIDIQVTDPNGNISGTNFANGSSINNIEGAAYIKNGDNEEFITIPNPVKDEQYIIKTKGTGEGGDYKIEVAKITENNSNPDQTEEPPVIIEGNIQSGDFDETAIKIENDEILISDQPADTTPPTIIGYATTQPNASGWYNTDVVVRFEAADSESGIESVTPDVVISTEGANQSVTGTAIDKAGNSATYAVSGINIDKAPPAISITSPKPIKYQNNQILPINLQVADNFSSRDKIASAAVYDKADFPKNNIDLSLERLGPHNLKITAGDEAGNNSETKVDFFVVTNLDAIRSNVAHYWNLKLIKRKVEKSYLEMQIKILKEQFGVLERTKSMRINPRIKELFIQSQKQLINFRIKALVNQLRHNSPRWIEEKAAAALIESLNSIRILQ
ncbi:MAG: alpha/beta fold hydrolase [Parcubacteria group bacterium]|jgi:pimeloyl-ACP methyl ester carboxylesterase